MKKAITVFLAFIGAVVIIMLSLKLLSNEDDWICVDGKWVRHGHPSAPMPAGGCGKEIESPQQTPLPLNVCSKIDTDYQMGLLKAKQIAQQSECIKEGQLTEETFCNENTGTWWINLDIPDKPGCNPACVVNVVTRAAEINWRCTGLIEPRL